MRFDIQLAIVAGSLIAAAPALAQNTTEQPVGTANTAGTDAYIAGAPAPGTAAMPDAAATPGTQTATLPPDAGAGAADTPSTRGSADGDRFPWGVLGVLGLLGLLGRRRRNRVIGDGSSVT